MTDQPPSNEPGSTWTIVVAAGRGARFGGSRPKQFVEVAGRRLVDWSVQVAAATSDGVVVVMPATEGEVAPTSAEAPVEVVIGGETRSASVRAGLAALPPDAAIVLVHDAARPLASEGLFNRVVDAVRAGADGVVPVVPVVDTLRHIDGAAIDRSSLFAVQTPQGFDISALRDAHAEGGDATDDATLVANRGGEVVTVAGERWNLKVTEPNDDVVVAALLGARR